MIDTTEEAVAEVVRLMGEMEPVVEPSWERVDLGPTLAGTVERVMPTVLRRNDGAALFYQRRVNGLHADSGVGKSMVLAVAAAQELVAGHAVGWIDLEDPDPAIIVERLRMFGVTDDVINERLHYYNPKVPFTDAAVEQLVHDATEHSMTMLVIDSLGEAFALDGIDEDKDNEVGPWLRRVARRLADNTTAAVVLIDHSTKAKDNPLFASGSKRKRAAITGASYLVEAAKPLTREDGGRLKLTCAKDRHGNYRRGNIVATVDITVDPDTAVSVKVWAPDATDTGNQPQARLHAIAVAAVHAAKTAGRPLSGNQLEALMAVKAGNTLKRAGIEEAVAKGVLRTELGPRRGVMHIYVRDINTEQSTP